MIALRAGWEWLERRIDAAFAPPVPPEAPPAVPWKCTRQGGPFERPCNEPGEHWHELLPDGQVWAHPGPAPVVALCGVCAGDGCARCLATGVVYAA